MTSNKGIKRSLWITWVKIWGGSNFHGCVANEPWWFGAQNFHLESLPISWWTSWRSYRQWSFAQVRSGWIAGELKMLLTETHTEWPTNHLCGLKMFERTPGSAKDSDFSRVRNQIATGIPSKFPTLRHWHKFTLVFSIDMVHRTPWNIERSLDCQPKLGKISFPTEVIILLLHFLCGLHWSSWSWDLPSLFLRSNDLCKIC